MMTSHHDTRTARDPQSLEFTVRPAVPADALALRHLAALDGRRLPEGRLLVAEVDGELWAAVAVAGEEAVADPFRRSGNLVHLLREHAKLLSAPRPAVRRVLGTRLA